jgi:hypothetical protein
MIIQLTTLISQIVVMGCSDCFSRCSNENKIECLELCNCPVFTSEYVRGGAFQGRTGMVYVPSMSFKEARWAKVGLSCDLQCSEGCSVSLVDSELESCVRGCGCEELLMSEPSQANIRAKCESLCRGSPASCSLDCVHHIEGSTNMIYIWVVFPALFIIFLLAWLTIRSKKEEDYVLI